MDFNSKQFYRLCRDVLCSRGGYGYDKPIIVEHGWENDLHFGMRASGGSFGVITEFLYKVYPQPETLSCLFFVFVETEYDFKMLDRAAKDGRYAIAIFQTMIFRKPKSSQLVSST